MVLNRDCKPIYIIEASKQYDEERNFFIDFDGNLITENYNLTASEVCQKLQHIPVEMLTYILKVNPKVAHPEWIVLTVLPVPPVTTDHQLL